MRIIIYLLIRLKRFFQKAFYSLLLRTNLIKKNVLVSKGFFLARKNKMCLGTSIYIGRNCHVGTNVNIGSYVLIASNVSFVGGDHDITNVDIKMFNSGRGTQSGIVIEDDVWIGHGAIVMDGIRLRSGSIVAAGAVVTKSFPAYSIIGGNPAKLIRMRVAKKN